MRCRGKIRGVRPNQRRTKLSRLGRNQVFFYRPTKMAALLRSACTIAARLGVGQECLPKHGSGPGGAPEGRRWVTQRDVIANVPAPAPREATWASGRAASGSNTV